MASGKGGHGAGSQLLCSWSIEQGKGREMSLRQDLCSYIFSWVIVRLWLGCVATVRDLRNKNIHVFFPVAVYSFCSKIFCSRCKGTGWLCYVESRGRQSSGVAFTRAPLKQSLFFSFKTRASQHARTPACLSLGCRTTPRATRYSHSSGVPSVVLAAVSPSPHVDS